MKSGRVGQVPDVPRYMRHSTFHVGSGPIILNWPDPLTVSELAFVEEFLALWVRTVKRRAIPDEPSDQPANDGPFATSGELGRELGLNPDAAQAFETKVERIAGI